MTNTSTGRTGRTALAGVGLAILVGALTACSTAVPSVTDSPVPVSTTSPVAVVVETPAPADSAPVVVAAAAPAADENSQVVDGQLYQGTASAPVRIGSDTPGQAPAAEAGFPRSDAGTKYAEDANKYVVTVFKGEGGWLWKALGLSRYGSFRELGNSGYPAGTWLPSRAVAAAGPFIVDGRELDRSEYILVIN
ncbi:MAG: hypothetical protein ACOH17_14200 [Cellulomonas sp.]